MPNNPQSYQYAAIVAGAGPVGLATALALTALGLRIAVIGQPPAAQTDARAVALMQPSVTLLEQIGVWPLCASQAEPMTGLRLIDATGRLLRAPETVFNASDIGLAEFGFCIAAGDLHAAMLDRARTTTGLNFCETRSIAGITISARSVRVAAAEGTILEAPLLIGADGRGSPSRAAAGIACEQWDYPQTALSLAFRHERPHSGLSIEFHRPSGPLTTVPLPGRRSSLVWVETPDEAKRLMQMSKPELNQTLRSLLHGCLGAIEIETSCRALPLHGLAARPLAQRRTALVGEAAHVIPPIGAQGLNLGLRDAATLAEVAEDALGQGAQDLGAAGVLDVYAAARRLDVCTRTTAVDLLNRSLLSAQLPIQALRGAGLHALTLLPPLRRALMQQGLAPTRGLPRLMAPRSKAN